MPDADGNGTFLQLNDVLLDSSIGTNWTAVDSNLLAVAGIQYENFTIYPNPIFKVLNVTSRDVMEKIRIYSVDGALLYQSLK